MRRSNLHHGMRYMVAGLLIKPPHSIQQLTIPKFDVLTILFLEIVSYGRPTLNKLIFPLSNL